MYNIDNLKQYNDNSISFECIGKLRTSNDEPKDTIIIIHISKEDATLLSAFIEECNKEEPE